MRTVFSGLLVGVGRVSGVGRAVGCGLLALLCSSRVTGRAVFSGRLVGAGRVSGRAALFSGRLAGSGRLAEALTGLAATAFLCRSLTDVAGRATAATAGEP